MRIAVDAMGGDFAPKEIVEGAIKAARAYDCEIFLVGDELAIKKELEKAKDYKSLNIKIVDAPEVIGMDEHPADAVRKKKNSSVVVATQLVKNGECEAVISAGSTGAAVASAQMVLGRLKGIKRPAIATPIPTKTGVTLLLDSGGNVDSKPIHLVQAAMMGSIYAREVYGIKNPRVGLLNIGEEETKGNEQALLTYPLLQQAKSLNFVGNAEGRDIPAGSFDVVVCDGFVGNVILKFAEGLAKTILSIIKQAINESSIFAKLGALMLKPTLKKLGKKLDVSEYGGAPLLGVNGGCIISHGSSNSKAIMNAIRVANEFCRNDVLEHIKKSAEKEEMRQGDAEGK